MCSSFPLKLGGEDEVLKSSLTATIDACGFMRKDLGVRASSSACGSGQFEQGREKMKNVHFSREGEREPSINMGGVGATRGGQREPHGYGFLPLEAWARRRKACVCVCVYEELNS